MRLRRSIAVTALLFLACSKKAAPPPPAPSAAETSAPAPGASAAVLDGDAGTALDGAPLAAAATAAPGSASATATTDASSSALAGAKDNKAAHCPNAVEGAKTAITDVEGGVQLVVTGKGDPMTQDIRARARKLLEASKNEGTTVRHSGNGEGGGVFGRCPVVMRDTTLEIVDVPTGSKITVKPKNKAELDWLRREARERQVNLGDPAAKGAGRGKMTHCPSAVEGADTKLVDVEGGVQFTVVAKAAAGTEEIRQRVKRLLQASKNPVADGGGAHDGNGQGGGGLGRCPMVLENTVVDARDVDGGSLVTVKAKAPTDVASLRKEARDRTQEFDTDSPKGATLH